MCLSIDMYRDGTALVIFRIFLVDWVFFPPLNFEASFSNKVVD
ncbi:MAG: hypothetical protein SFW07_06590 [Gammaproteobacteria bacterium]|nr:hypothetical protein [Gammaproteobacteria bacterium]